MDPTAPNNNNGNHPQSPIQPGQFVVAGESAAPGSPQSVGAQPAMNFASPPPAMGADTPAPPPAAPPIGGAPTQPDPTPFAPPGPTQAAPPPQAGGSSKMKMVLIILAIIILLAIMGAVVWFFILNKGNTNEPTTATTDQIEEPATPAQRTDGGFGELPESTATGDQNLPTETQSPGTEIPPGGSTQNP